VNNGEKEIIYRILVIDDNPNIHEDFKTILLEDNDNKELDSLKAEVFGDSSPEPVHSKKYELNFASQGKEGYEKIKQAFSENGPYQLVFVDMRMPPGWDGLQTIEHIWKVDPCIQVVICTAYSDYSWEDILQRLGKSQNLLILKKPFDSVEVSQLVTALLEKWTLAKQASIKMDQLEEMTREKTQELTEANKQLQLEIALHKQAEETLAHKENLLQMIISATGEAMILIGNDGLITLFNPAAEEMFGCKKEDMLGQPLDRLMPEQYRHHHSQYVQSYFATGKPDGIIGSTVELPALRSDGHIFQMEMSLSAGSLGDKQFVIAVARDITERKQTEICQDELLKKVDNINKELKDFVSIVSHDLKAPLRGIKTLASWIISDCSDKLNDQAKEHINLLLERVERMYNLIEGALQYSRAGQAEEKQVHVNLNNFVPEIIDMVVPPENITVTIENELPVIECEETHIMQLLQNLLSNAIKYMDKPQGWIKIGCIEQDGFWEFSVADNGPGIEEKHFERIFKIFQALPTSPDFEGTGVGLTVAKKIVELYEGRIWLESKIGEGSTFFFTLPKQKMEATK
jgi:PAS domain S-box-containing protein